MTGQRQRPAFYARRTYRVLSGLFGLCLAGIGTYALFFAVPPTTLQNVGGAVLVIIGANMVLAALRARESWLSRIGPLP
jgi:putative Mn2+ efflux pump MntP